MLSLKDMEKYKYIPFLAISPSEMTALQELPEKDKDKMLPLFQLKGWTTAKTLEKTVERIKKSIKNRPWIADIDSSFVQSNAEWLLTGKLPEREVFHEIDELLKPENGFFNWFNFIRSTPLAIPTIQWGSLSDLDRQVELLTSLDRGVVLKISKINSTREVETALHSLSRFAPEKCHVMLDLGQFANDIQGAEIVSRVNSISTQLPSCTISISGSSFPSHFSGYNKGENPIKERVLFNKVSRNCNGIGLIYSDRGGARAEKISGGGGIPSPRIDYPLKNDWRYVREEYADSSNPMEGEKERLYKLCADKITNEEYWIPDLRLWGTQLIEQTSQGDKFGINSPAKATAVRINIHLHLQLHYNSLPEEVDTDDDWID
ncbi:beta family protein [Paraglaciecola chathamensis]|uniref:beta family protein n=1 Tax=Paraglaciecola chathamensis TaxID=368405 RepID=UPI0027086629|nr:beta family protein [Paraglaciecola chathamensis]MDO6840776.1 beta family protein [Paraglaciecola chathamensis]